MSEIIILGHKNPDVDSIVSGYLLEKALQKKSVNAEFIIPDDEIDKESVNICLKYGLDPHKYQKKLPKDKKKYILVDHNNRKINGEVISIIDHHPSIKGINVANCYNKNISSTACYICQGNESSFSDDDLRLAFVATMVDTASFNSTKSREEDHNWIKSLCRTRNIDYDDIYKTGLCLTELNDIDELSFNGLKNYDIEGLRLESSYIQVEDSRESREIASKIIAYVRNYLQTSDLDGFVFIVHNMTEFKSTAYQITRNDVTTINYNEYTARGDKIIPDIANKLLLKNNRV